MWRSEWLLGSSGWGVGLAWLVASLVVMLSGFWVLEIE